MNPVLKINTLNSGNSIENNMLVPASGDFNSADSDLNNSLFNDDFSELLSNLVSSDGKLKPLDVAALQNLNQQQLSELQDITKLDLASDSPELKQLSVLSLLTKASEIQIENTELFGNPEVQSLTKINNSEQFHSAEKNMLLNAKLTNNKTLQEGLLTLGDLNKPEVLKSHATSVDELKHHALSKDVDLPKLLDDVKLTQFVKDANKVEIDFASEISSQAARQESNATKLVDQLASMDKSINPINQSNTQSLKSYTGLEQTGSLMNRIEVPVNQPGWGEAVGNRLMMMVNGKMQSANIHLNPAELGPIEIRVSVNQDQTTVHFISNNSVVREAIEEAFPRLKEMFSQNGLSLADANVSQQSPNQSSQQRENLNSQYNEAFVSSDNESFENTETHSINENMLDVGLINQYV